MNEEKTYLSREKLEKLQAELENLKTVGRKEVAERLEYAKSLGDLSENAEYQEALEAQISVEERIGTIEALLKAAIIVSPRGGDTIDVGSVVSIRKDSSGEVETYTLVGSEETNVPERKISNKSPLGEALFGKKKGDIFTYQTSRGEIGGTIVKVE